MPTTETLSGTVTFLLRREGRDPVIQEFELQLDDGNRRVVRSVTSEDSRLREGDAITVIGHSDANQILVAHTITARVPVTGLPPPPPRKRRRWVWWVFWLVLASPPLALFYFWLDPPRGGEQPLEAIVGLVMLAILSIISLAIAALTLIVLAIKRIRRAMQS